MMWTKVVHREMPLLGPLYNTLASLGLQMSKDMVSGASVEHSRGALSSSLPQPFVHLGLGFI